MMGIWLLVGVLLGTMAGAVGPATTFQTLPAWGGAAAIVYAGRLLVYGAWSARARSAKTLPRLVTIDPDRGDKLRWSVDENALGDYCTAVHPLVFASAVMAAAWAGYCLFWLIKPSLHREWGWFGNVAVLLGGLSSSLTVIGAADHCSRWIPKRIARDVEALLWETVSLMSDRFDELESVKLSITELAEQLNISFPVNRYSERVREEILRDKISFLRSPQKMEEAASRAIRMAREDRDRLQEAVVAYQAVMRRYRETASLINTTGSHSLMAEMEDVYAFLESRNLLWFVMNRKWGTFHQSLDYANVVLDRLRDSTERYARDSSDRREPGVLSDEGRAYRILGLKKGATFREIALRYRGLAQQYHPDKAARTTEGIKKLAEEHFKKIHWAWEVLRKRSKGGGDG